MARHVDATGSPIADGNGLNFESSFVARPCAVPGCPRQSMTFGYLDYGGKIGFVCSEHRADQEAIDDLISAVFDKLKRP